MFVADLTWPGRRVTILFPINSRLYFLTYLRLDLKMDEPWDK